MFRQILQDVFMISLSAKFMLSCVFHSARVFSSFFSFENTHVERLMKVLFARICLCYCKKNQIDRIFPLSVLLLIIEMTPRTLQ